MHCRRPGRSAASDTGYCPKAGRNIQRNAFRRRENVTNRLAEAFYRDHGVGQIERGLDLAASTAGAPRDAFGLLHPPRDRRVPEGASRLRGELWLERGGSRYRLEFDCDRCEMSLVDCTKTKYETQTITP